MKELKVRVWDHETKTMIYPHRLPDLGHHVLLLYPNTAVYLNYQNGFGTKDVMLYTELKDKNGVEIYEGDVLNHKTTFGNNMADKRFQSKTEIEVRFDQGCFVDENTGVQLYDKMRTLSSYHLPCWTSFEIIGNIHKNPELV